MIKELPVSFVIVFIVMVVHAHEGMHEPANFDSVGLRATVTSHRRPVSTTFEHDHKSSSDHNSPSQIDQPASKRTGKNIIKDALNFITKIPEKLTLRQKGALNEYTLIEADESSSLHSGTSSLGGAGGGGNTLQELSLSIQADSLDNFFSNELWNDYEFKKSLAQEFFKSDSVTITELQTFKNSSSGWQLQKELEPYKTMMEGLQQSSNAAKNSSEVVPKGLVIYKARKSSSRRSQNNTYVVKYDMASSKKGLFITEKSMRLLFGHDFVQPSKIAYEDENGKGLFIPASSFLGAFDAGAVRPFSISHLRKDIYYK